MMTKNQVTKKLERDAAAGDSNARVLLALRRGDPKTVAAHRAAIKTYSARIDGQSGSVRVTIPED